MPEPWRPGGAEFHSVGGPVVPGGEGGGHVHAVVADEYHSEETTTTQSSLEYYITCFNER